MSLDNNEINELAEIKNLIERVKIVQHALAKNERDLFIKLREKYLSEVNIDFEDKALLEIMLRNITIRREAGITS